MAPTLNYKQLWASEISKAGSIIYVSCKSFFSLDTHSSSSKNQPKGNQEAKVLSVSLN